MVTPWLSMPMTALPAASENTALISGSSMARSAPKAISRMSAAAMNPIASDRLVETWLTA